MKIFLTIVSMTLTLVSVTAVSAYCGNASGGQTVGQHKSNMQSPPGSLLAAEIAAQDSQGGAGNSLNLNALAGDNIGTPPIGTPGTGDPVPGCTNGKAVGNKHCVASPSK
jgi:hypothetical protein